MTARNVPFIFQDLRFLMRSKTTLIAFKCTFRFFFVPCIPKLRGVSECPRIDWGTVDDFMDAMLLELYHLAKFFNLNNVLISPQSSRKTSKK